MANLNLSAFDKQDYSTLLASDVLDASKGVLFGSTGLEPDKTNRTILIGLGGTGVRTIDYVKGAIMKRLDPSWKQYVAFLGVDTSWTEFEGASYLDPAERAIITKNGVAQRMASPSTYPAATRRFMLKGERLGALDSDGAGRTRLVGKIKIHDAVPGGLGVDEEIVHKLTLLKTQQLTDLTDGHGKYQIYVIGSVCGGTCSGTFLEMPALIRKVFSNPTQVKVNAMLYLPDTLAQLDPQHMSQLYANGYASLKELNYYMGMYMRPEYSETWSYNNTASSELTHKSTITDEGFYNVPYLVGTTYGPSADASRVAKETIAEFLISTLAKISSPDGGVFLTSAFESNATVGAVVGNKLTQPDNPEVEADGEAHEFPRRFAAVGFAEASAPQKLVRAYTVGKVCSLAGLKPVSREERNALAAGGPEVLLPFRAKDDLLGATEGTAKAEKLLEPLAKIVALIHSGDFDFSRDLGEQDITWKKIKERRYDNQTIANKTEQTIKRRTADDEMDKLRESIKLAYDAFRKNVHEFVREEGPYAFVNLYNGTFAPVNGDFGRGIGKMLQNLVDGKQMNGKPVNVKTPDDAKSELDTARNNIIAKGINILGVETQEHKDQAAKWVAAYNGWGKARINKVRRDIALGQHGALAKSFLLPAAKLADEVDAFGCILETMTAIYQGHGQKMEDFQAFATAQDNKTEVNLAALNNASYNWLKQQAEDTLATVNAHKLRDGLVDHFFAKGANGLPNTMKWLEFPEDRVTTTTTGALGLTVPEMPVPARELFDGYLAEAFPATVQVSIEAMFTQLESSGISAKKTATDIITQLYSRSKPQFNGDIPDDVRFGFIMYPHALQNSPDGKRIAAELESAAQVVCPNVQVYSSDDADSIMFYQVALPMEVYRLRDLKLWESEYEKGQYGIQKPTSYLHGMSPDLVVVSKPGEGTSYTEVMPWTDYPSITIPTSDPRLPDPESGEISREGKIRLQLDDMIQRARNLGVLYSEESDKGWIIKRVHCNKTTDWKFTLARCRPDPATGLLPQGKVLAETVAVQNNKTLESISRKVYLDLGGLMNKPHATEDLAWEFAARTLRSHVPMYIEVRETLKKFEAWAKDIEEFNKNVMKRFQPAKLVHMLRAGVLRSLEDGSWVYEMADGSVRDVLVMSMADYFMSEKERYMINNGLLFYYLFQQMEELLEHSEDAFDDALAYSKSRLTRLVRDRDIEALEAGKKQVAAILAEREGLKEKGARLDGDTKAEPKSVFVKALDGIADKDELRDIDLFYHRVGLWEKI